MKIKEFAYKIGMKFDGKVFKHDENFKFNHDLPCYIPMYALDENDIYSKQDIEIEVMQWLLQADTIEYLTSINIGKKPEYTENYIDEWVERVYVNCKWEHPATLLKRELIFNTNEF